MKFEIKHRYTGAVILTGEGVALKEAFTFYDADLRGANLRDADLGGANLRGANLRDADLGDANLGGANLRDANLRDADLGGANLRGANLRGANLRDANLRDADLRGANLGGADLGDANLGGANLRGLLRVPNIDAEILKRIEHGGTLKMDTWHSCETTHCRGGWAILLSGPAGAVLERIYGASTAAAFIYAASRPNERVPDFHASDEDALADIRKCAAKQLAKTL